MSTFKLTVTHTLLLLLLSTLPLATPAGPAGLDLKAVTSLPLIASFHRDLDEISTLDPKCCDTNIPIQSQGKVYTLLSTQPNVTGSTSFPALFDLTNITNTNLSETTADAWTWSFAAVQLDSAIANGDPNYPSTQFASITWLSAPGLWKMEEHEDPTKLENTTETNNKNNKNNTTNPPATWDKDIELCALHISFLTPPPSLETQRLGYTVKLPSPQPMTTTSTVLNSTTDIRNLKLPTYGNCDLAFTHPSCAPQIQAQVLDLYNSRGCIGLRNLTIDPSCAPNANTLVPRPFLVKPGKEGEIAFQREFFDASAGRPEGVPLGKGVSEDSANIDRVWGSVVNEVRPLVLVGKRKGVDKGKENAKVGMACVKGMFVAEGSRKVNIGGQQEGGDGPKGEGKRSSKAVMGLVVAIGGAVVLGMV